MAFGSAYVTVHRWVRRTSTWFADLRPLPAAPESVPAVDDGVAFKLRRWPDLPAGHKTAAVYRTLSLMTQRRVSRGWALRHSRMTPRELDRLLALLLRQDALDIIDISSYPAARN